MKFDMITIGDCTVDAFIKVEEATVHCKLHHEDCQICFSFANKIPYESLHMLSAGNCNNVAVGMARLGFKSAFYGTVGQDFNGKMVLDKLKNEKVSTEFMNVQKQLPTNFHFVLWYKSERTILIKHQPYKYRLPTGIENTDWIYFSSVGPTGLSLHPKIAGFLKKHTKVKMAFNPGTFQLRLGLEKLKPLFKRTEILFVNKEEAEQLLGHNGTIKQLAQELFGHGPRIVVITDGLNGSYCYTGRDHYFIGIYPHKPFESTGCGDAFATGFTAAIMNHLHVSEALRWGSRNGASVATKIGPQEGLVTKKEMLESLKKHPKFQVKKI